MVAAPWSRREGVWRTVAGEGGTLWIVATPIGTLADLGERAREVLEQVDTVLAEDTRRTRRLLSGLGISVHGRLRSLHEHNETRSAPAVVEELRAGRDVAIVSDAGTPVLSDPGFVVVRAVREAGLAVASVPGPSAFTAALAAAGQPPLPATLVGFLPPRAGARRRSLDAVRAAPGSLVLFLSPHRLAVELADVAAVLGGERPATLLAELSKRHERAETGSLEELAGGAEAHAPRGEYVLVVGPAEAREQGPTHEPSPADAGRVYGGHLARLGDRREALRAAARELHLSRRRLYALLVENGGLDR
jgi:16S rRNA (cytidine1402-2'-O)-methyltransferase